MQNLKKLRYIIMIILNTTTDQYISIIPTQISSAGNEIILEFINETTKEIFLKLASTLTTTNDITSFYCEGLNFLKENTFFNLRCYFNVSNVVIYKDRVFVTNQIKSQYSINDGQYRTTPIDNNNYITI